MLYTKLILLLIAQVHLITKSDCFVPAKIISYVITAADSKLKSDLGYSSETIVHEDIIKRGVLRSVVSYFYQQPNGTTKIQLNKTDTDYLNVKNIYRDYYGKSFCVIDLDILISTEFQVDVASVDFDSETKDLPYAHFDAETFYQSNQRVIDFMQIVYSFLNSKDYSNARKFLGKIMHTIHDFYSHSNWVEMGNQDRINYDIGYANFTSRAIATQSDNVTCVSNCTLIDIECNTFLKALAILIKTIGIRSSAITCPIKYFKCSGNIVVLDKLVSGYYVDQGLSDGTTLSKPENSLKCSHGGIVDGDSFKPAQGGINKDSGYYLFSPHADLHLIAARLAIKHTEHVFETIRAKIGDEEYAKFLELKISNSFLNTINGYVQICSGTIKLPNLSLYLIYFPMLVFFR